MISLAEISKKFATDSTARKRPKAASGFDSMLSEAEEISASIANTATRSTASIEQLLFMQEVTTPSDQRTIERTEDVLKGLKSVQSALVRGRFNRKTLEDLEAELALLSATPTSEELSLLILEIELCTAVALAKLR